MMNQEFQKLIFQKQKVYKSSHISKIKIFPQERQWKIVTKFSILDYIAVDDFCGDGSGLFGILDGHGGGEVS